MKIRMDKIREPEAPLRASIDEDGIRELAVSMQKLGQLQPIGVKPTGDGTYEIVFGHRRFLAAKLLGWREIKAEIVEGEKAQSRAAMLVENAQREDLSPVEEAYALAELWRELGEPPIAELCRVTGKSQTWVRSRMAILEMPEELQAALHAGQVTFGVAEQLARIKDPEMRQSYLQAAIQSGCTAAMAEVWVNAALIAQEGIARAKDLESVIAEASAQAEATGMEQMYTCFVCRRSSSWRRVNLLVVCGACQEEIADAKRNVSRES